MVEVPSAERSSTTMSSSGSYSLASTDRITVSIVAALFLAGTMTLTKRPEASGNLARSGPRRAKWVRPSSGPSQGRAGHNEAGLIVRKPGLALPGLDQGAELELERVQLPLHFGAVILAAGGRHAVLGEQRRHQGIGVSHDRDGDAAVEHPVEPEHDGQRLPRSHGHERVSQVPNQKLAEILELL